MPRRVRWGSLRLLYVESQGRIHGYGNTRVEPGGGWA